MSAKTPRLSVGTDPELMLFDRDGQLRSAIPIVNAPKDNKVDLGNGHKMFYDNVLVEFNVKQSYSEAELIENLRDCFSRATRHLRNYVLKPQSSATFPASETKHKDALVFGCEPEFCAYEMTQLNPPTCEPGNNFRSAGGHIHLGYADEAWPLLSPVKGKDTDDEDRSERDWGRVWVVRMMDLFVGIPALLIDHDPTSKARRVLYGKAGSHRPKEEYGVEYRPLSDFWLATPKLVSLIYRLSAFAVDFVRERRHLGLWSDENECKAYDVAELQRIVNESDIKAARDLMERVVKVHLPNDLYVEVFQRAEPAQYNFYREWGIG